MSWNMLDLAVRRLSVSGLRDWKDTFLGMSVWMQAILIGALVMLAGVSVLSCWWGIQMKYSARFAAGAVSVFYIVLIILVKEYSLDMQKALLFSALAGVGAGFLNAFLERVFQFAAGFVLGTVLSAWLLPACFHRKATSGSGRIWTLVIACAAGLLFAVLAKKLKFVLTALEGGVVLGLLCAAYLPAGQIPWVKDKLSVGQIQNLLPMVIAVSGVLIQMIQLLSIRAEQKSLQIPTGEERGQAVTARSTEPDLTEASATEAPQEEEVSMAQAEEILVEKARELALAAERSAVQARLKERYEDVAQGLYSTKVAAQRLEMSEEAFTAGMRNAGYTIPGEERAEEESAETKGTGEENPEADAAGEEGAETKGAGEENTETEAAGEESAETKGVGEENTETEAAGEESAETESAGESYGTV